MTLKILSLLFILGLPSVFCQCLHPPCPQNDEAQHPGAADHGNSCSAQTQKSLEEIQQNLTDLSEAVAHFRESVTRDLHLLQQNQDQETFSEPAHSHSSHSHTGRRHSRPHRQHQHRQRQNYDHHHHHHPDFETVPRAFLRPPKARNPQDFDFAVCMMRPNSVGSSETGPLVGGIVYLSQKKNSDTLYLHLLLRNFNTSSSSAADHHHRGPPGDSQHEQEFQHGFHVHETADFSRGCDSAGSHFNPFNVAHGGPKSEIRHVGDFGNVASDSEGAINVLITDERASLRGEHSIIGKSIVIHALEDDLGIHPDDPGSRTTGNSGARLACCEIQRVTVSTTPEHQAPDAPASENEVPHPTPPHRR